MFRFLILAVAAVATADVSHDGPCPDIKPVPNFNVTAYQGTWYEIQKTPNEAEKNGKCASAEYVLDGDIVKVTNRHVVGSVQATVTGTAKFAEDANNAGKLLVALKFGELTREQPLNIIATDYANYAVAYNCKFDEKKKNHHDNIWILSRNKKLEGDSKTAVDNFFKNHAKDIDMSKLVTTDFSEDACKFDSTSTVTEPAKH